MRFDVLIAKNIMMHVNAKEMMMKELQQGSDEWLALRKTKITGTDAAVILGISLWKTPYQLWEQKLGRRPPDKVTPAMQRGTYLEPFAREAFEKKTGIITLPTVELHRQHCFMMASLDGMAFERDRILEIKCGEKVYAEAEKGVIPPYYFSQMQHNMSCSDVDMCDYWCWLPDKDGIHIEVPLDHEYESKMIDKEFDFFLLMKSESPPEMTDKDVPFVDDEQSLFRQVEEQWLDAKKQLLSWEQKEKDLRQQLIDSTPNGSCQGLYAKAVRFSCKGKVNYSSIPELKGVDLDRYRGEESTRWRVSEISDAISEL